MTDDIGRPTPTNPPAGDANLAADRTFRISRTWRNGYLRGLPIRIAYWALIFAVVGFDGPATSIVLIGVLAAVSLATGLRERFRRSLAIGGGGVTYAEPPSLLLRTPWSNVERLVQLNKNPDSVALLLRDSGRADLIPRRLHDALKSTPYPFNRVIPLQAFVDHFAGSDLERRLKHFVPDSFSHPPARLTPSVPSNAARGLGLGVVVLPLVVAAGAFLYGVLTKALSSTQAQGVILALAVTGLMTPYLLIRHRGMTGERLFDAVGRILLRPGRGESRVGVFAPIVALYAFVIATTFLGGYGLSPASTDPSCRAAGLPAQATPAAEPQWPGNPVSSVALPLDSSWSFVVLTEDGVSDFVAGGSADFVASFPRSVRRHVRDGLVKLAVEQWPSGGVTTVYLYELVCADTPAHEELVFANDKPSGAGVSDVTWDHVLLGQRSFVRASYRLLENGSTVAFNLYEWIQDGHVFRLIARTDGGGDPKESLEGALSYVY
jgi:hypothetical protein